MTTGANETFSRFGGLWTDRVDAQAELERRVAADLLTPSEAERVRQWMTQGYVVLERAIPAADCAALSDELGRMWREGAADALMQEPGEPSGVPLVAGTSPVKMRVLDLYAVRPAALNVLFAPAIVRFLQVIFDRDPLLFQSLTFECGSEQGIHQDTAYVVVHPPLELAAAWIALEDVKEGSGELQYFEGSHRLPEFQFSGQHKHFNSGRDSPEQEMEWGALIHSNSRKLNFPLKSFLPKQGDVLIWAADLAHGGAAVKTGRSPVGASWATTAPSGSFPTTSRIEMTGARRCPRQAGRILRSTTTLPRHAFEDFGCHGVKIDVTCPLLGLKPSMLIYP